MIKILIILNNCQNGFFPCQWQKSFKFNDVHKRGMQIFQHYCRPSSPETMTMKLMSMFIHASTLAENTVNALNVYDATIYENVM